MYASSLPLANHKYYQRRHSPAPESGAAPDNVEHFSDGLRTGVSRTSDGRRTDDRVLENKACWKAKADGSRIHRGRRL